MKTSNSFSSAAMAIVAGVAFAVSAHAVEMAQAKGDISGEDQFQQYCALCHGADGRGIGAVTEKTTRPAADLTQIAKRNGGVFPFTKVAGKVLAGGGIAEHAPSSMPAWGKIFAAESDPVRAKATIFEVTKYVESLQEQ